MADIQLQRSAQIGRRVSAPTSRALARLDQQTQQALARIDAVAEVQAGKADAVGVVTQRALQGTAFLSQVEQQLAQVVPIAATRLQAVADVGALGLSQTVMDTATILRRV